MPAWVRLTVCPASVTVAVRLWTLGLGTVEIRLTGALACGARSDREPARPGLARPGAALDREHAEIAGTPCLIEEGPG